MNVLEYLEDSVSRFPKKTALAYKEKMYSFEELMMLSKQIGSTIKKQEAEDTPIGVIVDRDIDCIAFFLGVIYSKNFYVPIDPDMPYEKIKLIIQDSKMKIVLGNENRKEICDAVNFDGEFISMNDISGEQCSLPECQSDTPLYMVYTSGSTGNPKGVLKTHGAVISYIEAYCDTFNFTSDEIIGNQTPFYFDASAKDIYMMLKLGCTIEILPSSLFSFPTELIEYLNQKKVTFVSWVPTVLSIVAQLNPFSLVKPTTLKRVFFVGEVMPMKHLNKWRKTLPDIQYVNLYGQSEIAGICCYYEVVDEFENTAVLPIGKPLNNCKVYLVDNGEIITTPNRIGEIYIVSDALALCYYNDQEKTNLSFQEIDFGNGKVKCFKTGDLAQYDEQYNLIFSTRTDFQIKHMGRRIELGEIEVIANSLDAIQRCCCLYDAEKKKIVLFCQISENSDLSSLEIRSLLKDKLSDYMLPNKIIILNDLPLSQNGKIDRQLLKKQL